ncbi:MAG TPA: DUF4340 domain-containing protein [Gemmatimonadales bacterium]|nr:DUF4340 domain-containing protein [Gemmatimonadales bacterium]
MTPRQLARIALAFGALLLLWGATSLWRRNQGDHPGAGVLPSVAGDAVDTVAIARPADTVLLVRRDNAWLVNGHPADGPAVRRLLDALADSTRRAEPVAERIASHAGLGVDSAAGTRVRVSGPAGAPADLVVGHRTPDLEGGYLRLAGDSTVYLVRGPLAELLGQGADEWRDRRMGAVPSDSVMGIEVTRGRRSYRLRRTEDRWAFAGGGPADSASVAGLLDAFRRLDAAGFASAAQADSARFEPADRGVRLLGGDGTPLFRLDLDSTGAGYWARVDGGTVVYRLESWTADRLTPSESELRPGPASS